MSTSKTTTSGPLTIGIGVAPTEQEREAFRAGLRREVAKRAGGDAGRGAGAVVLLGRGGGGVMATVWILEGHTRGCCSCQPHAHGLAGAFASEAAAMVEADRLIAAFAHIEDMYDDGPFDREVFEEDRRRIAEWKKEHGAEHAAEQFRVIEVPVMAHDHTRK